MSFSFHLTGSGSDRGGERESPRVLVWSTAVMCTETRKYGENLEAGMQLKWGCMGNVHGLETNLTSHTLKYRW